MDMESASTSARSLGLRRQASIVDTRNDHLDGMETDFLYHLGLSKLDAAQFKNVRYLVLGGADDRMAAFANDIASLLVVECRNVGLHKRYVLFLCGPVLVCSHGMGGPSISILLHEIAKLLKYSGGADCVWIRIGTCGGLGVAPGTCVVTKEAVNGALEPWHETIVLGQRVRRPTTLSAELSNDLLLTCQELGLGAKCGRTLCCDDFYEGQARLDGAICEYDETAKMAFLRKSHEAGVVNIEMESLQFSAFTGRIGVQAAVIAVTFLDRLEGDQLTSDLGLLKEWEARPIRVVQQYILADYKEYQKGTSVRCFEDHPVANQRVGTL